jgi:hypothetical protein
VNPAPPFQQCSVDYFGPFHVNINRNTTQPRWGALFTCLVTRAVHIESVPSLSTAAFLSTLRIFCNTRGTPKLMYSDNGTNFEGAEPLLKPEELASDSVQSAISREGIQWKFQPPYAPHFGGVHEALVKSAKRAMYHVLTKKQRQRNLTDHEFRALLSEVMGFLNSRPLTYISSDHKDGIITPAHFLLQRGGAEPFPGADDIKNFDFRDTYRYVQAYANEVWEVWLRHYLPTLTTRAKWQASRRNAQEGDVVLVAEDNQPRNKWLVGVIDSVVKDKHGFVRSVFVRAWVGEGKKRRIAKYQKPVVKCCLLQEAPGPREPVPRLPVPQDFIPVLQSTSSSTCSSPHSSSAPGQVDSIVTLGDLAALPEADA